MAEQIDTLKALITGNDLDRYKDNAPLLTYALSWASSEILKRRNTDTLEDQYLTNQIEGAKYYLSRIGAEGTESVSENGVVVKWSRVPEFLQNVIPKIGVIHSAGT
ncbi:MAG TPA: hypothetical protein VHO94_04080 [Oscillospiraceae bacterium]|nr:hypothetical protein [Oscillospiraceae bacterium]